MSLHAHRTLRLGLRLAWCGVLGIVGGAAVWGLELVLPLPVLPHLALGFLAGGAAALRSFGVELSSRRLRLAVACATLLLAQASLGALRYQEFRRFARRSAQASDYRTSPAEVEERIDRELRALTGRGGYGGYALAALREGLTFGPFRLRGAALLLVSALELLAAFAVAAWWAAGSAAASGPTAPPT